MDGCGWQMQRRGPHRQTLARSWCTFGGALRVLACRLCAPRRIVVPIGCSAHLNGAHACMLRCSRSPPPHRPPSQAAVGCTACTRVEKRVHLLACRALAARDRVLHAQVHACHDGPYVQRGCGLMSPHRWDSYDSISIVAGLQPKQTLCFLSTLRATL